MNQMNIPQLSLILILLTQTCIHSCICSMCK